uniref:SANTA domain-containing protein n=1 Tax=Rhabditophanes sp. KR3021 TaxID=114890 RepID=A0AC35TR42_9BILA
MANNIQRSSRSVHLEKWYFKFICFDASSDFNIIIRGRYKKNKSGNDEEFVSDAVVELENLNTVEDFAGNIIILGSEINKEKMLTLGYSDEFIRMFQFGFPKTWVSILKYFWERVQFGDTKNIWFPANLTRPAKEEMEAYAKALQKQLSVSTQAISPHNVSSVVISSHDVSTEVINPHNISAEATSQLNGKEMFNQTPKRDSRHNQITTPTQGTNGISNTLNASILPNLFEDSYSGEAETSIVKARVNPRKHKITSSNENSPVCAAKRSKKSIRKKSIPKKSQLNKKHKGADSEVDSGALSTELSGGSAQSLSTQNFANESFGLSLLDERERCPMNLSCDSIFGEISQVVIDTDTKNAVFIVPSGVTIKGLKRDKKNEKPIAKRVIKEQEKGFDFQALAAKEMEYIKKKDLEEFSDCSDDSFI